MTTQETKKIALEMYPIKPMAEIVRATGLRKSQIKSYAVHNGVRKIVKENKPSYYNHIAEILEAYPKVETSVIMEKYSMTFGQLTQLAFRYGVKKNPKYNEEREFIRENYQKFNNEDIGKVLGISTVRVCSIAFELGIKKENKIIKVPEYYKYKDEILSRYPIVSNNVLCEVYGITRATLMGFAHRNGVRKLPIVKDSKVEKRKAVKELKTKELQVVADIIKEDKPSELELAGFFDADKYFKQF